jgi:hypothetical protein
MRDEMTMQGPVHAPAWMVWLKRLFALLAAGCLLYFGWHARELLGDILASASAGLLLAAVVAWLLMHALSPLFAALVFAGSGITMPYRSAVRIHLANLPARYIPGGIWHTVGRVVSYRNLGVDSGRLGLFVLLENILSAAVAFLLGGVLLAVYRGLDHWGVVAALSAAGGVIVLLAVPVLLRSRLSGPLARISAGHYLAGIVVLALNWCAAAAAFVLFVSSFRALALETPYLETAAAYLFSWGVGFVAVFAPQGVGVFEVMAGELLRGSLALGGVAVLLAGFRLVIFIADLAGWAVGRLLLRG